MNEVIINKLNALERRVNDLLTREVPYTVDTTGATTFSRIVHIDNDMDVSGNIGIGTTPTYTLDLVHPDVATGGIRIGTEGYYSVPNPGTITDSIVLNARGVNFTTDSVTTSTTSFGMAMTASRSTPLLVIKNTGGPAIVVEAGDITTAAKVNADAGFYVAGNKVVGARGSAIANTGTTTAAHTTTINAILAMLRTHGMIMT